MKRTGTEESKEQLLASLFREGMNEKDRVLLKGRFTKDQLVTMLVDMRMDYMEQISDLGCQIARLRNTEVEASVLKATVEELERALASKTAMSRDAFNLETELRIWRSRAEILADRVRKQELVIETLKWVIRGVVPEQSEADVEYTEVLNEIATEGKN